MSPELKDTRIFTRTCKKIILLDLEIVVYIWLLSIASTTSFCK